MANEFSKALVFYKAKKDGNGAASQWSLSSEKNSIFLEMTNQKGKDENNNARFDWENKIRFKLDETDIGEILAVLMNLQNGIGPFDTDKKKHKGLFHSNPKGNAILYFGRDATMEEHGRFHVYLSVKRGDDQTVVRHTISKGEACILSTLLRRAIEVMYRWG
jgi:hypothetical protein